MDRRRVVVTGLGVVSPAGLGKQAFWNTISAGRSCVRQITQFDASACSSQVAAEVPDFDLAAYYPNRKDRKFMERSSGFASVASKLAIQDAKMELDHEDKSRIAIYMGTSAGAIQWGFKELQKANCATVEAAHPHLAVICFLGTLIGSISIPLGITGRGYVLSSLDVSGTDAIGHAYQCIRHGSADVALAGGTEAPVTPIIMQGLQYFLTHRCDSPSQASRPFDKERDGAVLGEGCAVLVLEELNHAVERGAHIYSEVIGYSTTGDGSLAEAIRLALEDAKVYPKEVDYINAHACSCPVGDVQETEAIREVFGPHTDRVPVSSIKSTIGHPLAASGAMQAVTCALVMEHGKAPPTANLEYPDPVCDLNHVRVVRDIEARVVLQNSCGLNGSHSALLYHRFTLASHN